MSFTRPVKLGGGEFLEPNPAFGWRFFPKEMAREATWFAYPEEKAPQTIRIFVLGGSAAQGDPEPAFGLARILEVMLKHRYPEQSFEVVNAAMTAINSHVVREIAGEVVDYDPDLLVVYMGNNEVVGPYGAGNPVVPMVSSLPLIRASLWTKGTRLGQVTGSVLRSVLPQPKGEGRSWRGMELFLEHTVEEGASDLQTVYRHFQGNLEAILNEAGDHQVPVLLGTVSVNLRDCAPFGSSHRQGGDMASWDAAYREAVALQAAGQLQDSLQAYTKIEALDDRHAELHYRIGTCLQLLGRVEEARQRFSRARDLDILRFRADARINQIIREAAAKAGEGVILVDAEKRIGEASPAGGIPGSEVFFEHVHFNFHGNYLLARTFLEQVEDALAGQLGKPRGEVPTESVCAARLAYTPYDEYSVLQLVLGRLSAAPFTNQCDIDAQVARWNTQARKLENELRNGAIEGCLKPYEAAVGQSPNDPWLRFRHGYFLLNAVGDLARAEAAFHKARQLGLETPELWLGIGMSRYRQGRIDDAIVAFREGLAIQPRHWRLLSQLGYALNQQGIAAEGLEKCRLAAEIAPEVAEVHDNLGLVLMGQRRYDEARTSFETAMEHGGETPARLVNLGMVHGAEGARQQAIGCYSKALALDAADFRANREMGRLMLMTAELPAALKHYDRANQTRPGDLEIANDLAWLLATIPDDGLRDGARAMRLALAVCSASDYKNPAALDTLAAAHAECGQFDRAVAVANKALSLSRDAGLTAQVKARLATYQQGRPFRESSGP